MFRGWYGRVVPWADEGEPVDAELADAVRRAAATVGVRLVSAYLFGSRAEGRSHRESDIDVAVLLPGDQTRDERGRFETRVALTSALIAELHDNAVDLVLLNETPPHLARRIVTRGRRILCTDPDADRAFVRDVQLRAADLEPFLRRARATKLRTMLQ
jgi:predicted nucleotidyltransferase